MSRPQKAFSQEQLDAVRAVLADTLEAMGYGYMGESCAMSVAERLTQLPEGENGHPVEGVLLEAVARDSAELITPWDLFAAACLVPVNTTTEDAARYADEMMAERAKRMGR